MYLGDSGGMVSRLLGVVVLKGRRAEVVLVVAEVRDVRPHIDGLGSGGGILTDGALGWRCCSTAAAVPSRSRFVMVVVPELGVRKSLAPH